MASNAVFDQVVNVSPRQTLPFGPIPKAIGAQLAVVPTFRSKPCVFHSSQYSTSTRPVRVFAVTLG
ncbi:hypothetical protein R3P38DRAFT_3201514 [Favolaschia claudopus]|uniref:Uncharacterized protein n=1 Tax=Favolaschia claudopus TaxID=2862362 RepID=A0AAW0AUR7_9AGAR